MCVTGVCCTAGDRLRKRLTWGIPAAVASQLGRHTALHATCCLCLLQLSDQELENMRVTKAALTSLINRVSKVRQELEVRPIGRWISL